MTSSTVTRIRSFVVRATAGTAFAVFLLVVAELVLRLVLGAPEVPLVRSMPPPDQAPFAVGDGMVTPVFQGIDAIDPFPARPTGLPRVVFAGASSVRGGSGLPLSAEFPARTIDLLQRPAEALNLGRPALDSAGVRRVVDGALAFEPRVVVLYLGHNEVGNIGMKARFGGGFAATTARVDATLSHLQLYALTKSMLAGPRPLRATTLVITPEERAQAATAFRTHLRAMVSSIQDKGATPILLTPLSDLAANPGAATCPEALPSGALLSEAGKWVLDTDLATVDAALAAAPECPDLLWARGLLADDVAALRRARSLDPVPMRAPGAIVEAIRTVAREAHVPLVDLAARFDPPDPGWFVDPVHLSAEGHAAVATALAPALDEVLQ